MPVKGVAIVTGAADGIGRAIALRLGQDGFDIAIFDLPSSEQKAQEVADQIKAANTGRRVLTIFGDVSQETDVKSLLNTVVEQLGGLDVVRW